MSKFIDLQNKIIAFRNAREWQQFHDPKNLAEAISIESAELQEIFLWKSTAESNDLSDSDIDSVSEELSDIFIFLTYMCHHYNIDLLKSVERKIEINNEKYPVEKAKGSRTKYTDY